MMSTGLGRIVTLCHRSSTSYGFSRMIGAAMYEATMRLNPRVAAPTRPRAGQSSKRGSAGRGVKGVFFDPPEQVLTSFHTIIIVRIGGHPPTSPSF
jgi:hypothetical protein